MKGDKFIEEVSNAKKLRVFLSGLFVFVLLVAGGVWFLSSVLKGAEVTIFSLISGFFKTEVLQISAWGLLYSSFLGGLFFIPIPQEAFFYISLASNGLVLSFILVILGYMLSQVVNYYVGFKISKAVMYFISRKKVYKFRRYVNKYGAVAILAFNIFPTPAPLVTFALGIAKYNFTRLMILTLIGNLVKYSAIIGFFVLVS